MLISHERQPLRDGCIELAQWVRAPLYLGDGNTLFATLDAVRGPTPYHELVVTAIAPEFWSDLWRIEIEAVNAPGVVYKIISLLTRRNIRILQSESTTVTYPSHYMAAMLVACNQYVGGDLDMTHRERVAKRTRSLPELERELKVYLANLIAIDPTGAPRVTVRRLSSHLELIDDVESRRCYQVFRDGYSIQKGSIELTQRAMSTLKESFDGSDLLYVAAVDTKDRLIRCLIFGEQDGLTAHHLRLIAHLDSPELLETLFHNLLSEGANIIRHQLRPAVCNCDLSPNDDLTTAIVDVTFDLSGLRPAGYGDRALLQRLSNIIHTMEKRSSGRLHLVSTSWVAKQ